MRKEDETVIDYVLRRISEAQDSGTDALGLSGLGAIDELPPEVVETGFSTLHITHADIRSLASLGRMRGLRALSLELVRCDDWRPLKHLHGLEELFIQDSPVADFSFLGGFKTLRKFNVNFDLEWMNWSPPSTANFSALANVNGLEELRLFDCPVLDISAIRSHSHLQTLELGGTPVSNFHELTELKQLVTLILSATEIPSVDPILSLGQLRDLEISHCALDRLPDMTTLKNLEKLRIASTEIDDLSPLEKHQQLKHLDVSGTVVMDLSPVTSMPSLQSLNIDYTRITDLSPLRGNSTLSNLSLKGTRIAELDVLLDIPSLWPAPNDPKKRRIEFDGDLLHFEKIAERNQALRGYLERLRLERVKASGK